MMKSKVTYRQQYTRCGKQRCRKCREGPGHGPYWYAYWHEKGRTVSKYIGTHLPEEISGQRSAGEAERASVTHVATQNGTLPILRIYLLGQFRIERKIRGEWRSDEGRHWHRRRARSLLGCLLSSPGRRLSREQIMEQLWPELSIDVAANRLNGAVHELRQILEPDNPRPAASRLLRLEHDILELADHSQIWVDAEAFEQLIQAANASTDVGRTLSLLEEATALYRGSYLLEELYSEWAIPRRDALQRAWVGLLLRLAELRADQKNYSGAIEILDRLRIAEPTNETALQRLMLLLTHLDRRGEALHAYQQYVAMLKRDYDGEPFPETVRLYEQLRQGFTPFADTSRTSASPVTTDTPAAPGEPIAGQPASSAPSVSPDSPLASSPARAQKTPEQDFSFTRPDCQIGRPNQSPLIGRDKELALMRRVLLEAESVSSTSPS
ncbi:MAG: winged helix-turn-helix domain-containing protein, partial [Ktedonobacteraceae bacterium]|nr:winged helix-turn-helix domain-containing protein [Ktedonobacteraceae bacterium]